MLHQHVGSFYARALSWTELRLDRAEEFRVRAVSRCRRGCAPAIADRLCWLKTSALRYSCGEALAVLRWTLRALEQRHTD